MRFLQDYGPLFEEPGAPTGGAENPGNGVTEAPKTFTQEEVDRIVSQRLQRESGKYSDYDEVKTTLTKLQQEQKEREEAEMSEIERYKAQLSEKETLIKDLEQHREWRSQWEQRETEAITAEMEGLSDAQKGIVDALPLDQRRTAIAEFKATQAQPKGANFGKTVGGEGMVSLDDIKAMSAELGPNHPQVQKAYAKYRAATR